MSEQTQLVTQALDEETLETFEGRVATQAADLREAIAAGEFDNRDFSVGLELEVYAVDTEGEMCPTPIPDGVFDSVANKELGVHNAELNTPPNVLDGDGLAAQSECITERFESAQQAARSHGVELVNDAMWTIPPAMGSAAYLESHERDDGVSIADNMRADPRYIAIDNEVLGLCDGGIEFSVPGVEYTFRSILFESLATSIQPHLQIPSAEAFPTYYNAAIRTLGPVVALSTNSPFLPADFYTEVSDPAALVDETHHELRIAAFEQSVNESPNPKVRVPRDLESTTDVVDRVIDDDCFAPFLREWLDDSPRESFGETYWEFDYKRSTYWRWLRCVIGGDPVDGVSDERSLRIEYRPIPTQPTIPDIVGMQALTVGLIRGLVVADHPLCDLPWESARDAFYSAVESGLDAELAWVTADGERTTDTDEIFGEVFEFARLGLAESGVPEADIEDYLAPIEARWQAETTPSHWKKDRVREHLADGDSLPTAIERMQRTYIERSRRHASFADWL